MLHIMHLYMVQNTGDCFMKTHQSTVNTLKGRLGHAPAVYQRVCSYIYIYILDRDFNLFIYKICKEAVMTFDIQICNL